jgi:RimJ/RimL family protein N-acetyltransferase
LRAAGVVLCPLSDADLDGLYEAVVESSAALSATMPWWRADLSRADQADWIGWTQSAWTEGRCYSFAIRAAASQRYLGSCSVEGVNWTRLSANLSYWVRTSATGRGVASNSVRAVAQWALLTAGLQRAEISMVTTNTASMAVARKAGAVHEGVLRNWARYAGASRDMSMFSFVPGDFAEHGRQR